MLKKFLKNINVLNVLLIIFVLIFAQRRLLPRLNIKLSLIPNTSAEKSVTESRAGDEVGTKLSPEDYRVIPDKNLFHPDRKIVKPAPPPPKPEEKLPMPDFVLYGTMITDNVKLAFIDDRKAPYSSPGGGRRHRTLKIGDTLSGFTIKDIDQEKVILARNDEEVVLKKSSSSQDKKPGQAPGQAGQPPQPQRPPQPFTSPRSPRTAQQPQQQMAPTTTVPGAAGTNTAPTIITVPAVQATPPAQPSTQPKQPAGTQKTPSSQQQGVPGTNTQRTPQQQRTPGVPQNQ